MKHLKFIVMMLVAANIAFVSSCKKDDDGDDTPVSENPSINLAGDGGFIATDATLEPGTVFNVKVTASENATTKKNLVNFKAVRNVAGVKSTEVDSTFNEKTFQLEMQFTASTLETTDVWTFTITDKDGKSATASFTITTEAPVNTTPLATEVTDGKFYHVEGSLKGAYDLVGQALKGVSDPDTDKDLKNTDAAGATFTGSSTAGNGTTFVKDNSIDYAGTTTVEAIASAYAGGTASGTITNPQAGDKYIAKLRGGDDYMLIQILTVDPADNTCSCSNKGIITFKYKGK
jgi:hypothetical protein